MHSSTELHKSDDKKTSAVTDPVCGMTVDPDSAAGSYEFKGQTYHFCSTHCLHEFREDPERFLNKPAKPMMAQPVGIQHAKTFPLLLIGMSEFIPGADVEWLERLVRRQQSL